MSTRRTSYPILVVLCLAALACYALPSPHDPDEVFLCDSDHDCSDGYRCWDNQCLSLDAYTGASDSNVSGDAADGEPVEENATAPSDANVSDDNGSAPAEDNDAPLENAGAEADAEASETPASNTEPAADASDDPNTEAPASTTALPWRGGSGGGPAETVACPSGSVAVGVKVNRGDNADKVRLVCRQRNGASLGDDVQVVEGADGGSGGTPYEYRCDSLLADGIMVGQRVWVNLYVYSVDPVCESLSDFIASQGSHAVVSRFSENHVYALYEDLCPAASVIQSMVVKAGLLTDGIQFVCAP